MSSVRMIGRHARIITFALACAAIALPRHADAQPAGSYRQTCRNNRVESDTLFGSCRDKHGRYHNTSLAQVSRCVGQISNDDGVLRCSAFGALPSGTYQQTCRNSRVEGDTLFSSCRDVNGRYRDTSLAQVSGCVGAILNDNGTLRCSSGALPRGTYAQSCTRVRVDDGTLLGECRKIGGGNRSATLADYKSCWTDIANVDGFFSCDKGDQPAPGGSYRATCREIAMKQSVLSAQCLDYYRNFKTSSLDIGSCRQPIENHNGQLACGPKPKQPPATPSDQAFSAVEVFNCQGNKRSLAIWKADGSGQNWAKVGDISSSYVDNICPGGPPGLTVQLAPGPNVIRALDTAQCGQDDPKVFNCEVAELSVMGDPAGRVEAYVAGN